LRKRRVLKKRGGTPAWEATKRETPQLRKISHPLQEGEFLSKKRETERRRKRERVANLKGKEKTNECPWSARTTNGWETT